MLHDSLLDSRFICIVEQRLGHPIRALQSLRVLAMSLIVAYTSSGPFWVPPVPFAALGSYVDTRRVIEDCDLSRNFS